MQDDVRIVHMHIPKTAGTALRAAFEKHHQGKKRIFPHYDERKYAGINPQDFDFFSGHFGYKTAATLQGEIVCLFRNPVDRFVSVYYFWRQLHEKGVENTINTRLAAKFSIDEFVRIKELPGLIEEFYNRTTWQVAHGSMLEHRRELREAGRTEEEIYRMALANLQKFAVVGIQENIPQFAGKVKDRYGIGLNVQRINVTESRSEMFDLPIRTIREIQGWLSMDIELYEFVRGML